MVICMTNTPTPTTTPTTITLAVPYGARRFGFVWEALEAHGLKLGLNHNTYLGLDFDHRRYSKTTMPSGVWTVISHEHGVVNKGKFVIN